MRAERPLPYPALNRMLDPRYAAWLAIGIGTVLRLVQYWRCPSMTQDESSLVINILTRSYRGLTVSLSFDQYSPAGFLWVERLLRQLFGPSEYSLRLFPLVAGLVSMPVVWIAARRFAGPWAAAFAAALVSFAPGCLRYSNEVKQYGIETLVTAAILAASAYWPKGPLTIGRALLLAAGGVAAISFSFPAVYVLAGLGMMLAMRAWDRRASISEWVSLAGIGAAWGAFSGTIYWLMFARHLGPGSYMNDFWGPMQLLRQPHPLAAAALVFHGLLDALIALSGRTPALEYAAAVGLLLMGAARAAYSRDRALLLLAPLLFPVGPALFGKWIYAERLMMYSVPLTVLLMAMGAAGVVERVHRYPKLRLAAAAALCAILLFPLKAQIYEIRHTEAALRSAVQFAVEHTEPGDTVYIYSLAVPGYLLYSTDWAHPDSQRIEWMSEASRITGPNGGNIHSRGRRVEHEGFGLRREYRGGAELVGIGDGRFGSINGRRGGVDPGWVENELARVCREGAAGKLIIVGFTTGGPGVPGIRDFDAFVRAAGAQPIANFEGPAAMVDVVSRPGCGFQ